MAIYKNANLDISVSAEQNPNYNAKPSVQFSTQDKNTAKYTFTVKQNNKPVDLTGVTASVTLYSEDKSVFQSDATITSATEGKIEYVIPSEAIRHHGKTRGDLRLTYPNGDVLGGLRFSFNIEQALIDRAAGVIGGVYIRDFEQLKAEIEETVESIKDFDVVRIDTRLGELEEQIGEGVGVDEQARQEIQEVTAQLAKKANKADVRTNTTNNPITLSELHTEVKTAMTGGSVPVVGVGAVGPENVKDKAIQPKHTSFFSSGKNLFTGSWVLNRGLDSAGAEKPGIQNASTDFVTLPSDSVYTFKIHDSGFDVTGYYIYFYDENKAFISPSKAFYDKGYTQTFTKPTNAKFVRFSIYKDVSGGITFPPSKTQLEIGNKATDYDTSAYLNDDFINYANISNKTLINGEPLSQVLKPVESMHKNPHIKGVAHRGYSQEAPENTALAYILAKQKGFEYVECDLQFTKDNVPVLFHDTNLDIKGIGTGVIADKTLSELQSLDFGRWKDVKFAGTRILTYADFLILCRRLGLKVYLDIKPTLATFSQSRAELLYSIAKKLNMHKQITWMGDLDWNDGIRLLDNTARVAIVDEMYTDWHISTLERYLTESGSALLNIDYRAVTQELSDICTEKGIDLEVWTVNDKTTAFNLSKYNIKGISTDTLNVGKVISDLAMQI